QMSCYLNIGAAGWSVNTRFALRLNNPAAPKTCGSITSVIRRARPSFKEGTIAVDPKGGFDGLSAIHYSRFETHKISNREGNFSDVRRRSPLAAGSRIEQHCDHHETHGGQYAFAMDGFPYFRRRETQPQP